MATATERTDPGGEPAGSPGEPRLTAGQLGGPVLALTILGFALASYRLGTKSLWLDEAVSANHARLGLSGLWTVVTSHDPNMGLYYVLLHFWTRVFGYSEAAVRSMTVVLAGFAVPVMYLLGRRLFGRSAGIIAALLLAVGPFFVQYEQTARSYALVVLLVLLSSYFFVAELGKPSRATLVAYVLASALAVYAHYFAALVLVVQALTLIAVRRRGAVTVAWLSAAGAIVALCIPAAVFAHRAGTSNISWIHTPGLGTLVHLPTDLAGSRLLALVLGLLACYGFARALADRQGWQAGFVAAWLIVPVILVFAVSRLGRPLFVAYYLIVVLPAFVLLASAGVAKLRRREASWAAAAALVVLSVIGVRNWYDRPSLEDYRAATHHVLANERSGDGVVYYPAGTLQGPTSGFAYYDARRRRRTRPARIRLHRRAPAASASDLAGHAAVRHPCAGATEVAADARARLPTGGYARRFPQRHRDALSPRRVTPRPARTGEMHTAGAGATEPGRRRRCGRSGFRCG